MLFLLSPAKSLDYDTPVPESVPHTRPQFVPQSTALIEVLREKSVRRLPPLMAPWRHPGGAERGPLPGLEAAIHRQQLAPGGAGLQWRCVRGKACRPAA